MADEVDEEQEVEAEPINDISALLEDIKKIKSDVSDLYDLISEKNDTIELLRVASIDYINIDMQLIADELYNSESRLSTIGTEEQFDILREVEKKIGVNMAYKKSKLFLEEAGSEAKLVIPTLNIIKLTLEKISEKLKYSAEA